MDLVTFYMNLHFWTGKSEQIEYGAQKKVVDMIHNIIAE